MTEIPKSNLYEIIFRNPPAEEENNWLRITDVAITSGILNFEGRTENLCTYSEKLTSASDIIVKPGSYGVVRAFPRQDAIAAPPAGRFSVHTATGVFSYKYPWDLVPEPQIPGVDQYKTQEVLYPDVLIVGSGPLGATYARKIITEAETARVLMVEMGAQESVVVGENKKNSVAYQRDIDSFVHIIKGALSTLSIPVTKHSQADPWPWGFRPPRISPKIPGEKNDAFVQRGQNPDQSPYDNLTACAATRVVGGMATHWTCSTPEQLKGLERSDIFTDDEWDLLYTEAKEYLGTSRNEFEESIRHQLVKNTLLSSFKDLFPDGREVLSLPLACKRNPENPSFVTWAATNTILGATVKKLHLLPNHQCTKLLYEKAEQEISLVVVKNLELTNKRVYVCARKYVVCGGVILTPQILYNSGFRAEKGSLPALGHWLTEQPMAFCQVILHENLVGQLDPACVTSDYPDWVTPEQRKKIEAHRAKHPEDPLPFPFNDPEPQITTPVHQDYPWHTQIHRDAFSYGDVAPNMDSRLVVDLRWFGMVEPEFDNCVKFSNKYHDQFNMPQPTFHFTLGNAAKKRSHDMMEEYITNSYMGHLSDKYSMIRVSLELGRYIPGSEPRFMEPGMHVCGTTRAGESVKDSVVDKNSKVWGVNNLWLGGTGVIPTRNACNPTLTSMCFAIVGADQLIKELAN